MKASVRIEPMKHYGVAGVLVRFPFDRHFIEQIKAYVPRGSWWFNEHRGAWWVAETHADLITHLAREAFGTVTVVDAEGVEVTHTPAGERLYQEELL